LISAVATQAADSSPAPTWLQKPLRAKSVAGVLSAAESEAVRGNALGIGMSRALLSNANGARVSKERTCDWARLSRTPEHEWLYRRILAATEAVNDENWRFALTGIDNIGVLRYRPLQRHRWHFDTAVGSQRKLTCVINLSPPDSYWGGGLDVKGHHDGREIAPLQGSGTWFPAYLEHRARAPWRGERWSLVAIMTGPAWV
jgi:predicted 2-oxoglutarate/Fe(II)-dependent dioxygenase YbiX